jgi:hypothetical protein
MINFRNNKFGKELHPLKVNASLENLKKFRKYLSDLTSKVKVFKSCGFYKKISRLAQLKKIKINFQRQS